MLKVAGATEDDSDWRSALAIQRLAADAGLAPAIVHVDEPRRAVLTVFVADRSFAALYLDPGTREAALTLLGRTVRRIHALPVPAAARVRDPRAFLAQISAGLRSGFALPEFAGEAIQRVLAEDPPRRRGHLVLGHNDLNPTNFIYDGEGLLVLDWAAAGPMDAFYDLAVLAVFLRMDEATCLGLLSAYDGDSRHRVAGQVHLQPPVGGRARRRDAALSRAPDEAPGSHRRGDARLHPSLGEFYQRMRAGELKVGTADGQWAFGLALMKESLAL